MKNQVFKIAIGYSLWIILWLVLTLSENADGGVSAFLYLTITGLPFSLLGWNILPNGGLLSLIVIGMIGLIQWVLVSIWYLSKK